MIFNGVRFDYHIERVTFEHPRSLGPNNYQRRESAVEQLVYKPDGGSHQLIDGHRLELVPESVLFIPSTVKSHSDDVYSLGSTVNVAFRIYGREKYDLEPQCVRFDGGELFFKLEAAHHLGRGFRCQAIFSDILDRLANSAAEGYADSEKYKMIAPAVDFIEKHCFTEQITTERLCELCGISGEYLRRLFRRFTGKTPIEYINALRLENARELLVLGKCGVTEAAIISGFASPGYFSRLFTHRFGYPPSSVKNGAKSE